jgi:hypothetical protein
MLAELAEVVVGVETRSQTHTAAVVDAGTGAVLARATVIADPDAYHPTCRLAEQHSGLRAWAMKGTAGAAPTWPDIWPTSWSSNSTRRSGQPDGRAPSPTPSTSTRGSRCTGPHPAGPAQDRCRAGRTADAPDRTTRRHPRRRHRRPRARRCPTGSSAPETGRSTALCTPFSLCRLQRDERTRIYAERRRAEGKTDREIKRCLKRYIARELNPRPESPPLAP